MAGSTLALILIPIGSILPIALWIFVVFYVDSHPVRGERASRLDSGEYDTGLQGTYLTKPELRLPRQEQQERGHLGEVPAQRQAEQGASKQRQDEQGLAGQRSARS